MMTEQVLVNGAIVIGVVIACIIMLIALDKQKPPSWVAETVEDKPKTVVRLRRLRVVPNHYVADAAECDICKGEQWVCILWPESSHCLNATPTCVQPNEFSRFGAIRGPMNYEQAHAFMMGAEGGTWLMHKLIPTGG
jgi:hypothetical protein